MKRLLAPFLACLALLVGAPAWAAFGTPFSLGTTTVDSANANTSVFSVTTTAAVGDTVVVQVRRDRTTGTIDSVTDSAGNCSGAYSAVANASTTNVNNVRTFYCKLTSALTGGASTITATFSSVNTNAKVISAVAVSGANVVDKALNGSTGTSTAPAQAITTLAEAREIIFASLVTFGASSNVTAEASGYAAAGGLNIGATYPHEISYRIVSANTADTPTWTLAGSSNWLIQILSFTETTPPPPSTAHNLMLMGVGQ